MIGGDEIGNGARTRWLVGARLPGEAGCIAGCLRPTPEVGRGLVLGMAARTGSPGVVNALQATDFIADGDDVFLGVETSRTNRRQVVPAGALGEAGRDINVVTLFTFEKGHRVARVSVECTMAKVRESHKDSRRANGFP